MCKNDDLGGAARGTGKPRKLKTENRWRRFTPDEAVFDALKIGLRNHLEAEALVEQDVLFDVGLEVRGRALLVDHIEKRAQHRLPDTSTLELGVDTDGPQVPAPDEDPAWPTGSEPGGSLREIVREQWSFSPHGSTSEVEDYRVDLDSVSVLELALKPDLTPGNAFATVAKWRVT